MSQVLVPVGVACLLIALAFGAFGQTVRVDSLSAPGPAAYGTAGGFAIAGGLCLLAAAVAKRNTYFDTVRDQATRIDEMVERISQLKQELAARPEKGPDERPPG